MKTNKFFMLAVAGLALTACSFDDTLNKLDYDDPSEIRISATMSDMTITRGTSTTLQATSLESGSTPAIYICKDGKTTTDNGYFYQNLSATVGSPLGTGTTTLYFPQDKTNVDVYVYAPKSTTDLTNVNANITHTVSSSQGNATGYLASDFVWGKADLEYSSNATNVNVTLSHKLSKIIFHIQDANGQQVQDIRSVTLAGVYDKVDINMSTGALTANISSTTTVTFLDTSTSGNDGYINGTAGTNVDVAAILPPQDIQNKALTINIGGSTYTGTIPEATASGKAEIASGNEYTYTITLSQNSFTVTVTNINAWTTTGNDKTGTVS